MSRDRPARMTITAAIIILALAVSGTLGYLVGPLSDDVHEPRLDKKSQPAPGDGYMYLRGELTHRTLWSAGAPAEGLLLAEANSAEGVSGSTSQASRAMNPGEGRHKDLLPVNKWDVATLILASAGLMIAAAGGIGGGGILVPIFILVLGFSPKFAVPLSNIAIFGGAITNMFFNMKKRHPLTDRPLVDWDLILAMEPLTIGGALVGSFIQKVLPEIALTLLMVLLLLATANRVLRNGVKTFKKESSIQQKAGVKSSAVSHDAFKETDEALLRNGHDTPVSYGSATPVDMDDSTHNGNGYYPPAELANTLAITPDIVANGESVGVMAASPKSRVTVAFNGTHADARCLEDLLDHERKTPLAKIGVMTVVFVGLLALNLLKGGGAFRSPLGIVCGSFAFWATSVLCLVYLAAVSLGVRQYLLRRWRLKENICYPYIEGDIRWSPLNTVRYPAICCFAGFFAGMFGVGGGIVKGPLMLEMGVHPKVASATSAVMILYTSFTATTTYVVFGVLKADYAIVLFFLGLVATAVGQAGTDFLLEKFKRPSLIILSIGAVVALSALLMGYNGAKDILDSRAAGEEMASGICDAGV